MTQFTQLGLSGEPNKKPQDNKKSEDKKTQNTEKPSRHGISDKKAMAFVTTVVVGAVAGIFLLQTEGCSREESKPVASMPANQVTFNPAPAPVSAPVAASQAAEVKKPAKKVVKKPRPALAGYDDQTYGVSFKYPRKYMLKSGENKTEDQDGSKEIAMNFVQAGGVSVAKVEVPKETFPGTDLSYAAFDLNVNKELTEGQCYQFALPKSDSSDQTTTDTSKVKLGVTELQEVENLSGPATQQSDAKYYHVYDNAACYEFALGLATENDEDQNLTAVNREQVFQKLEKILATVKIKPLAKPEVKQEVAKITPEVKQEVTTKIEVKPETTASTPEVKAESTANAPEVKSQDSVSTQAISPVGQDVTQK